MRQREEKKRQILFVQIYMHLIEDKMACLFVSVDRFTWQLKTVSAFASFIFRTIAQKRKKTVFYPHFFFKEHTIWNCTSRCRDGPNMQIHSTLKPNRECSLKKKIATNRMGKKRKCVFLCTGWSVFLFNELNETEKSGHINVVWMMTTATTKTATTHIPNTNTIPSFPIAHYHTHTNNSNDDGRSTWKCVFEIETTTKIGHF